jgi:hypothetical protein
MRTEVAWRILEKMGRGGIGKRERYVGQVISVCRAVYATDYSTV